MGLVGDARRVGKWVVANALYRSGVLEWHRVRAMRASAVVLLYHRVLDRRSEFLDYSPSGMSVREDAFDAQMAYLRQRYDLIALSELTASVAGGGPLRDNLCAVTFDDGWLDNYTHAFPVLKRHNVPATIFLATNYIEGTNWFWEERFKFLLGHVVQQYLRGRIAAPDERLLRSRLRAVNLESILEMRLAPLRRFLSRTVTELRSRTSAERGDYMSRLEQLAHLPGLEETRQFMNWAEIREMEQAGVRFGAHTVHHVNLERADLETAEAELAASKAATEKSLQQPAALFAYPYGKNTPAVCSLVAKLGFTGAFTTRPGLIKGGQDPFRLNRIDIHDSVAVDLPFFACRTLHLLERY